jgi:signal recognition particle-docking protein FtsY
VETTRKIISSLTESASRKQLRDAEALYGLLKDEMGDILAKVDEPLNIEGKTPFVILMVGVNGVGKTTTIGKLARQFEQQGKSVMLAAGDTFRAAAVEQLQVWGQRNNIPVVAQHTGADSASVIFDAIQAAKARNIDVLIADTAGRLQNKSHLMEELKKIVRVMKKLDVEAPHEVMLTIDASTGQNAISQAKLFHEAVGLTGLRSPNWTVPRRVGLSSLWLTSSVFRFAISASANVSRTCVRLKRAILLRHFLPERTNNDSL